MRKGVFMTVAGCLGLIVTLFGLLCLPAESMVVYRTFDEIVQRADVIFTGTAVDSRARFSENRKMIFTDVDFQVERLVYCNEVCQERVSDIITLTFAGGTLEGQSTRVSGVPSFKTGERYLLFSRIGGKPFSSPIVGVSQGLFRVVTDEVSGVSYPLARQNRPVVAIAKGDIVAGPPVARIYAGTLERAPDRRAVHYHDVPPQPVEGGKARVWVKPVQSEMPRKIMSLDEMIGEILQRIR